MTTEKYPRGWNEPRVRRVLEYYETQTDEEAAAEIEAGSKSIVKGSLRSPSWRARSVRSSTSA